MIQFAMVVLLILTPRSSNPFFCRYRGSASAYFSYMICDTRDAEAYPPGISAGLPSSFMNRGSSVSLQAGHPQVVAMYTIRSSFAYNGVLSVSLHGRSGSCRLRTQGTASLLRTTYLLLHSGLEDLRTSHHSPLWAYVPACWSLLR